MNFDRAHRLPSAVAFDLDGTLVDSVADLTEASNRMLAEYDRPPLDEATLRGYIGDGARKLVLRVLGGDAAEVREALRRFRRHYGDCLLDHTQAYPGVVECLHALREREIPLCIVTNKPHEFSVRIVQGLGLWPFFDSIVGARKGVPVKPAPEMLETALAQVSALPAEAWMVGDSSNDIRVARSVGSTAIGVSYGIGSRTSLEAESPDYIFDALIEMLALLP